MADYHFHVTQIKRSAGQSAVAAAAYRAGEKLYSSYYGEISDFTYKGGIVETGILLPEYIPEKYSDREYLWNEVEKIEKGKKAQLAYSFDFALQNEFTAEENIEIVKRFLNEYFVSRGMICDFAIHNPEKDGIQNPHCHVLVPMRPMDKNGQWMNKQERRYHIDEAGNRIRDSSGNYIFDNVKTTDWGDTSTLEFWREKWAEVNNEMFEKKNISARIDNRSYEKQGLNLIPTIHEGVAVREMEKRGIHTNKGELNRFIRSTNVIIKELSKIIADLVKWIFEELNRKPDYTLYDLLCKYLDKRNAGAYSDKAKVANLQKFVDATEFMRRNDIITVADFNTKFQKQKELYDEKTAAVKEYGDRLKNLKQVMKDFNDFLKVKPIYEEYEKKKFKTTKDKYYAEHQKEINQYQKLKRKLDEYTTENGTIKKSALQSEIDSLTKDIEALNNELIPIKENIKMLDNIRYCVNQIKAETLGSDTDEIQKSELPKETEAPAKSQPEPQKKESVLGKLSKAKTQVDQNKNNSRTVKHTGQEL